MSYKRKQQPKGRKKEKEDKYRRMKYVWPNKA